MARRIKKKSIQGKETAFMESNGQAYSLEIRSCYDNLKTLETLSVVSLPLCLWLVLKTLNDGPDTDMKFACTHVAILGMTSLIKALTTYHYDYLTELWGLKLKVALIGLVYKKVSSVIL